MLVTQGVKPDSTAEGGRWGGGVLMRLGSLPGAFGKREVTMYLVHTHCGLTSAIQTHTEEMGGEGWGLENE